MNLAAAYVATFQFENAIGTLTEASSLAEEMGANRLLGNCFELWGQLRFWQGDYQEARIALDRAKRILGGGSSADQLLMAKAESMLVAYERRSLEPLLAYRQLAENGRQWESVRDIDLLALALNFDANLLDHLTYGTPLPAYRRRIERVVGKQAREAYFYGARGHRFLELRTGSLVGSKERGPRPGGATHKLIAALCRDFYVPQTIGLLFSQLYPGEHFDVDSSPFRINQQIMRARQWIESVRLPMEIEQDQSSYRLRVHGDFGIKIELEAASPEPCALKFESLEQAMGQRDFSVDDACREMKWSRSAFHRIAAWAIEHGALIRVGTGRSTRYRFCVSTAKVA